MVATYRVRDASFAFYSVTNEQRTNKQTDKRVSDVSESEHLIDH
jgi:hypothetical protein